MAETSEVEGILCPDCGSCIIKDEIRMHFENGCTEIMYQCDGCSEIHENEADAEACCPDEDE